MLSPPNGLAWAKAGVTNIAWSFMSGSSVRLVTRRARAPLQSIAATKSARTIAAGASIATLVCLGNPADFALPQADLAAPPGPR
jgi:hypothetical protein